MNLANQENLLMEVCKMTKHNNSKQQEQQKQQKIRENAPGYEDKKLGGPNRPST